MITKINKIFVAGFVCCCVMAVLSSCSSDDDDARSDLASATMPTEVQFTLSDDLSRLVYTDDNGAQVLPMVKGQRAQLTYSMKPDNVTYKDVTWSSSNTQVATVDAEGNVEAISGADPGYTMIQVSPLGVFSSSGINAVLKVAVSDVVLKATAITINAPSDEVFAGDKLQLTATVAPVNATYRTVNWSSSDESIATVDARGLVTAKAGFTDLKTVDIIATAFDGSNVTARKTLTVMPVVAPQSVSIDQSVSAANGYVCAMNEKSITLEYTTVPAFSTKSTIEWSSSDETIATVDNGVVTFNTSGVYGEFTITATCPETGNSSSVTLNLGAGKIRELFHDVNNIMWNKDGSQKSTQEWHDGYLTINMAPGTSQRGDILANKVTLHAGDFPIVAFRLNLLGKYPGVTKCNITLDGSGGSVNGAGEYKGGLGGNNNKWLHEYECSDGSYVIVFDLATQAWTGGLLPTTDAAVFNKLTLKYADVQGVSEQLHYNVYWMQTFKNLGEMEQFMTDEGLTWSQTN